MTTVRYHDVERLLQSVRDQGRTGLYENECYELLTLIGAEVVPQNRLIPIDRRPTATDLDAIPGDRVVLKVVSPDITRKTEARGVHIVAREVDTVEAAFDLMLREVPDSYANYLEANTGEIPSALVGLGAEALRSRLASRIVGILLCSRVEADARGFATELLVGVRDTTEFGPVITAGLGGVDTEVLARHTRPGSAVVIAPTGTVDGAQFLELFKGTLSYQRLTGALRGSRRLIDDAVLQECFQAFIDLANHLSAANPSAPFHLVDFEVNPFAMSGGRMAPLDGVCAFRPASDPPPDRPITKVASIIRPKSIALLGASDRTLNPGRVILRNLLQAGFAADRTYVIRDQAETLDGVRCVPSIERLPEKVDLLVVAVGAEQAPAVAAQVIENDLANAVILVAGGLGETEGSQPLEAALRDQICAGHRSEGGGPIFLGGNSMGVVSEPGRYDTMFIPKNKLTRSDGPRRTRACFISQSGAFIITNESRLQWLDPAYALSIGNQIDLTAGDLMRFLHDDPEVDVFAVYVEGFRPRDGLVFASAVAAAVDLGKDVVLYKAGRTSEGRSATAGHTASVAGDYAVCAAAVGQAGGFVASDFDEFADLVGLCLALRGKELHGNRLAAISNAGFEAVGMADAIGQDGAELRLVPFTGHLPATLHDTLARHRLDGLVNIKNPLDLTPMAGDDVFAQVVQQVLDDPAVDVAVVGVVPLTPALQTLPQGADPADSIEREHSIARRLPAVAADSGKPVVAVVDSGRLYDPFADSLERAGMPVFRSADRAVRVLCRWVGHRLGSAGHGSRRGRSDS